MKKVFFTLLLALPALAAAQSQFSFDSASACPGLPEPPAAPPAASAHYAPDFHIAASLMGEYLLTEKTAGSCYERLEIVPETFGNAPLGGNIGIYGLPRGQGLIVSQVLEINTGLRFDRYENPMVILPFQSGFLGYRPRQADFDGNRLVYRTGELRKLKPARIKKGDILEVVARDGALTVAEGKFDEKGTFFSSVCRYTRIR